VVVTRYEHGIAYVTLWDELTVASSSESLGVPRSERNRARPEEPEEPRGTENDKEESMLSLSTWVVAAASWWRR